VKSERERHAEKIKLETTKESLVKRHAERQGLYAEHAQADRKRLLAEKLADLLGPKNLQRHLLHEAEVKIVENANRLLGKLAGGALLLRLLPEDENEKSRALQLVCDKTAEGTTRNLAYLSGSEKFRVAVSLALGIGQYASRQHRPIECVIIDEGFGCLDRKNRELMIEEIGKLKGLLRSVMLVSHQEEFADAFPDGFRFALEGGTTVVTPVGG
jgi:DNA repair exonuclease SbcCD ATPase subunit